MKPENRCLVPVNSFAEYAPELNPGTKKDVVFSFADIWTQFNGYRGTRSKPIPALTSSTAS
jgi:putative SOS response-associated peptidase YedK